MKHFPADPDLHFGLARAYAPSDAKRTAESLAKALELNPRHVPALMFQADHLIDSELYEAAAQTLEAVLAINPSNPDAWSDRAVLAHLRGDSKAESAARDAALESWKTNPEVDYRIGQKLSQKYRFEVGAAHQRRALQFDPDFCARQDPARPGPAAGRPSR